ncbi:MAG: HNH endonuclease [Candidatus Binatia bacterium]|nr:HNH endonuclease [Candidatus Binatia bacterium]
MLTQTALKKILDYDPATGIFRWAVNCGTRAKAGAVAGWTNDRGYRCVGIKGKAYKLHRLAWLYMTGAFPNDGTDHKFGDKADNRFKTLRVADQAINQQNRRKANRNNTSGLLGAHFHKRLGKFCATIWAGNKLRHIGVYETAEQAHAAYVSEKRRLHPGCTI